MRTTGLLVGVFAAVIALTATPAHAATGLVDGTVSSTGTTCSWADAVTSDVPPNPLTAYLTAADTTCSGGVSLDVANDPSFTFTDGPGDASTASVSLVAVSASAPFIGTCDYQVSGLVLQGSVSSRTYSGSNITATEVPPGRFLCPNTVNIDSLSFTFH